MTKLTRILAIIATTLTLSSASFAAENPGADWGPGWGHGDHGGWGPGWDHGDHGGWGHGDRGGFACFAQNIQGQTFRGFGRVPQWAARMAMQECYRGSFFVFGRTCRVIGCRQFGGWGGGWGGHDGGWDGNDGGWRR
jgi:hypothetical protein